MKPCDLMGNTCCGASSPKVHVFLEALITCAYSTFNWPVNTLSRNQTMHFCTAKNPTQNPKSAQLLTPAHSGVALHSVIENSNSRLHVSQICLRDHHTCVRVGENKRGAREQYRASAFILFGFRANHSPTLRHRAMGWAGQSK